ncbi:unnamed protein product [Adineta ricciae]|uniref:mannosyl-oligosaccharide 1,3-1,6-alpha-mannosidase n=1 Tax=Adineta ricciae TaxID=249248 RepID=A0A814Q357_ADIRI|nr:unnamed protein product [Adineta ricciae]
MLQAHDHHIRDDVCMTRPPYRNGKKPRAVKVYTIAQESKYLLVQNIPSIAGAGEQLVPHFSQYGAIEQYWKLDGYERKDPQEGEQFLDTMLIKYVQISRARVAKCRLDDLNFMGSNLHVCYAPECETLDDLKEKIQERKTIVRRKSELNKFVWRKPSAMTTSSQSVKPTTNDIRLRMREIVQKSNLIPIALQQEMKIAILVLLLLISPIELRRHENEDDDDNYELSDLLKEQFNQYQHHGKPSFDQEETNTNDDDDDQYYSSSHRRTKTHPSRKKVLPDNIFNNEDSNTDDVTTRITSSADKITTPTTNDQHDMSDSSVCTDKYDIKSEQLVRVKELTSGARMIRYTLVDKRTLPMGVTVKDGCMSNCCAEKSCDLAMLSEQPTHNGYKCYLFACNGSCILASHQDYTVMTLKSNSVQTKQESVTTASTFMLYFMLDSISTEKDHRQKTREQQMNEQLDSLEDSIQNLDKILKEKKQSSQSTRHSTKNSTSSSSSLSKCFWRISSPMNTTFNIRQLYERLPFDNQNGGVWTQGFDIQYNTSQWTATNKLKIIVMPHSHCDPGWLNTFEQYFKHVTKHILTTIVTMLGKNANYRFVWAEMSFLSLWWDQATNDQRELLKKALHSKQLEIVTGGWVMNDEANTHYFAMLDQLIEGHQFIEQNIGNISIENSWANDPFGYSPTMAYLLQRSGIQNLAIQRIHYHIKKELAREKQLEFLWQQPWDRTSSTRIFTHVLPFYAYDIPYTCGPDPKICCQFDFKRGTDSYISCSWGIDPVTINEENLSERSQLLLDQYRKKAQLYRTNVLFIQLGDDFRYRTINEARLQFDNYDKLFAYMNQRADWNVQIQYGTLNDYFDQMTKVKSREEFPSYVGDFFTYADRTDNYWSGYYTSRAFFKRMDRIVESYLRASEILFSVACVEMFGRKLLNYFPTDELFSMLTQARRNLGLFQHHDGITGTAKSHVVNDYGRKLLSSIHMTQNIIEQSAAFLLFPNEYFFRQQVLASNEVFPSYDLLSTKQLLVFDNNQQNHRVVYIYNPTDQKRSEIIQILSNVYHVHITSSGKLVKTCQIGPKWSSKTSNTMEQHQYELFILVNVEPYSIKDYTIHSSTINEQSCQLVKLQYINEQYSPKNQSAPFPIEIIDTKLIQMENRVLEVTFSKTGAILNLHSKLSDENLRFHTNMIQYGTTKESDHHSGAYLFIPNGNAQEIPMNNFNHIRVQHGLLVTRIDLINDLYSLQYRLTDTNDANDQTIELDVLTHLTMNKDIELGIRLSTGIKNGAEFFTDLNGFQMIRRKTYEKLPLQGNVYPMPTMAYIEDDSMRFTVLAGQPSGVACLKPGVMDIFLDRRLTQDDGRGLGQGVTDNREIISTFKLLFERRHTTVDQTSLTGYPTLLAHHLSIKLLYPMYILQSFIPNAVQDGYQLFAKASLLPSDYHLVNIRTLNNMKSNSTKCFALILRRFAYDCDDNYDQLFHFKLPTFTDFFPSNRIQSIEQTSLSLRHVHQYLNYTSTLTVPYAELATYKIHFY